MYLGKINLKLESANPEESQRYLEIFTALLRSGGLTGVRGGKTIIHFDADGVFQGIELDYWPWRRRKQASYDGRVDRT